MVFPTIESANKAEITILSAPDTMNVLGIYCISGLHMVYQLRMYACMYASGNICLGLVLSRRP